MSRKTKSTKQQGRGSQRPPSAAPERRDVEADVVRLEDRTREELYQLAQRLEIAGHAELSRQELIEAIRRR